jgi:hypothetical protein
MCCICSFKELDFVDRSELDLAFGLLRSNSQMSDLEVLHCGLDCCEDFKRLLSPHPPPDGEARLV